MGVLVQILAELFVDAKLRRSRTLRTVFWLLLAAIFLAYVLAAAL